MSVYSEISKEIKEINETLKMSRKQRIAIERAILTDLMEKEGKCRKCPSTTRLTLDHIVPRSILQSFGVDIETEIIEGNYQLLCYRCNQFKAGRLDFATPETKKILIKLLKEI